MLTRDLLGVLDEIPDTGEIVIRLNPVSADQDLLRQAWRNAQEEAGQAYTHWGSVRTREAFAVFRAAEDRADAAQDALAAR
jgi:hypothetical protein